MRRSATRCRHQEMLRLSVIPCRHQEMLLSAIPNRSAIRYRGLAICRLAIPLLFAIPSMGQCISRSVIPSRGHSRRTSRQNSPERRDIPRLISITGTMTILSSMSLNGIIVIIRNRRIAQPRA